MWVLYVTIGSFDYVLSSQSKDKGVEQEVRGGENDNRSSSSCNGEEFWFRIEENPISLFMLSNSSLVVGPKTWRRSSWVKAYGVGTTSDGVVAFAFAFVAFVFPSSSSSFSTSSSSYLTSITSTTRNSMSCIPSSSRFSTGGRKFLIGFNFVVWFASIKLYWSNFHTFSGFNAIRPDITPMANKIKSSW